MFDKADDQLLVESHLEKIDELLRYATPKLLQIIACCPKNKLIE